jgi:hypothetical protein
MNVRELKDLAARLYVKGKFMKCAEIYAQLVNANPDDAILRVRYAEACQRAGLLDAALESYRDAGDMLFRGGFLARAQAALKLALALKPRDPVTLKLQRQLDLARAAIPPASSAKPAADATEPPGSVATPVSRLRPVVSRAQQPPAAEPLRASGAEPAVAYEIQFGQGSGPVASVEPVSPRGTLDEQQVKTIEADFNAQVNDPRWEHGDSDDAESRADAEEPPRISFYPQVRRMSDRTIAFKPSPEARWVLLTSASAIAARFVEDIRDLTDADLAPPPEKPVEDSAEDVEIDDELYTRQ